MMYLTGFIRVCHAKINSFKLRVLNTDKVPSATRILKEPCSQGPDVTMTEQTHICRWHHCYQQQQHFIFGTEDPAAPADRLCINIHSNKILLTPSGHLKHGPCDHHINFFFCELSWTHLWLLCFKFWLLVTSFEVFHNSFVTWTQSGTSQLLQPSPSL